MMDELRKRAEALARANEAVEQPELSPEAMRQTLHELRVHQIELEMQNEGLRRAQAELDASRAHYFDLYDLAPVGYCTVSERGLILEANLTAAKLLGVPRGELARQPLTRFIHNEDQDSYYAYRKQLFATGLPAPLELRLVRKDGTDFWANLSTTRVQTTEGGDVCRMIIINISERKRDEQFRENVERIVRHDIKGPLINLFSLVKLSLAGDIDTATKEAFPHIMQGIRHIILLIDAAEPLLQMEKGTYTPRKKMICLHQMLCSIKNSLAVLSEQFKSEIKIQTNTVTPPHCETMLFVEEFLIEDMLMNLIKNAVEASPAGKSVSVAYHEEESGLRITIHNQGTVPESIRDRFFEKDATAGKMYGTGLGTYSAQLIAKAHGGFITFSTTETEGTTVTVLLPSSPTS